MAGQEGLGDVLGGIFGENNARTVRGRGGDEKGLPWEAKVIDGKYYIPLSQVSELLDQNGVLPKVSAGIKRRVEKGPPAFSRNAGHEEMNDA